MADVEEVITLRSYLEALMNERDKNYGDRFRAAEIAVLAALDAQQKAVATAFLAAEKATLKSEEAQRVYNEGHNEVNARMDAQYNRMIPREEASVIFKSLEDKVEGLRGEVVTLREYKSKSTGSALAMHEVIAYSVAVLSIIAGVLAVIFK